jgi:WD40 repeat protein
MNPGEGSEAPTLAPPGPAGAASEAATLAPVLPADGAAPPTRAPEKGAGPEIQEVGPRVSVPGYAILGLLGKGGMGVVYKARHLALQRTVALKMILHADHAGADQRQRFQAEAEAVARLQHPNIVQVYEVGEHGGLPFFSLEFCAGGSLADRLDGTPWPADKAAELVRTLAGAMHAAHQANVVHRDLKPANVLLTADGQPKVTDFGLAKKLDEAGHTQTGAVMGTPSYMAPEQAGGKSREIGPAADVYALGAILYELLTGRPPFKAATPLDILLQVASEEPAPPSQLQRKVPRDLETVCLTCLHKQPGRRYASAAALAEDLGRFLAGEPVRARPVGRLERGWRWCKRYPAAAALLAVSLAFGLTMLLLFGQAQTLRQNEADARRAAESSRDEAERGKQELEGEKRHTTDLLYDTGVNLAHREWHAAITPRVQQILADCPPRLRGWEWDFLKGLMEGQAVALRGHRGPLLAVALTPDGGRAVTVGSDETVRVWDAHTGIELRTFPVQAHRLALSPDGRRLALAIGLGVRVHDLATGRKLAEFDARGIACGLAFAHGGADVAVATAAGDVKFFDAAKGSERSRLGRRLTFDGATLRLLGMGQGVVFGADGRLLAQGGVGDKVRVWDAQSGEEALVGAGHRNGVGQVAFSPDGRRLASPGGEGEVRVWDLDRKQSVLRLSGHASSVHCVTFSPDGRRLLSGSKDLTVRLWDAQTGEAVQTLRGHGSEVVAVAFAADGRRAASASLDGTARVWEVGDRVFYGEHVRAFMRRENLSSLVRGASSQESLAFVGHLSPVTSLAFSPDGRLAATATAGDNQSAHDVTVWDLEGRRELHRLTAAQDNVLEAALTPFPVVRALLGLLGRYKAHHLAFSPDGRLLAVSSAGGPGNAPARLSVFDAATGRPAWHWEGPTGLEMQPAFAPGGAQLAAVLNGERETFLVAWEAGKGKEQFRQKLAGSHTRATYTPDGLALVTAGAEAGRIQVEVYDARTGQMQRRWPASAVYLSAVGCGPGGVVAGAGPEGIKLWDLTDGRELGTLEGHAGQVMSLAFSPDGSRLLSGGSDFTVRLWRVASKQELLTFREHSQVPTAVAWSPDGRRIGAADGGGVLKVWSAPAPDTPSPTDDWPVLFRDDFSKDGPADHWQPAFDSHWEIRGGSLRSRQVRATAAGTTFPIAIASLSAVDLPRAVEVRVSYRAEKPQVMGVTLSDRLGQRSYSPLLWGGGPMPHGPCVSLMQITPGAKISDVGVGRKFTMQPGRWRQVRVLREPERIRVYVDGEEYLSERIPDIDLPRLSLQGAWGEVGDEIEFKDLEIRAPAGVPPQGSGGQKPPDR